MSNETTDQSTLTPRQLRSAFQPEPNDDGLKTQSETVSAEDHPSQMMRPDAPTFVPTAPPAKTTTTANPQQTPLIIDLKKYKYDYFISKLSCSFDSKFGAFASPRGICTLSNDQLLVANYETDSLLLLDIQGTVHQIYRNLPSPKDVLYGLPNPSQVAVATRKEMIILDLETQKIVLQSKIRGFYPWNIQYIKENDIFAACDPSGERIIFLDKDLAEFGTWSFQEQSVNAPDYKKLYPYASYFFPDDTALVLTNRENKCELREGNSVVGTKKVYSALPAFQAFSIYADSQRKCLIADKDNRRLISITPDSIIEEYKSKSIQEPYSMTFLSTGTLCVTDWNLSYGTRGGIAVISENEIPNMR